MTGGTTPILWIEEYVGERSLTILSGGARHDSNSNGGEKSPNRSKARRNRIFSSANNLPRAFSTTKTMLRLFLDGFFFFVFVGLFFNHFAASRCPVGTFGAFRRIGRRFLRDRLTVSCSTVFHFVLVYGQVFACTGQGLFRSFFSLCGRYLSRTVSLLTSDGLTFGFLLPCFSNRSTSLPMDRVPAFCSRREGREMESESSEKGSRDFVSFTPFRKFPKSLAKSPIIWTGFSTILSSSCLRFSYTFALGNVTFSYTFQGYVSSCPYY